MGQIVDRILFEYTRHDTVRPAVEIAGHVLQRLAIADGADADNAIAAELFDRKFESQPSPQRRLLEQQRQIAAGQRLRVSRRGAFDFSRELQQIGKLVTSKIQIRIKVARLRLPYRMVESTAAMTNLLSKCCMFIQLSE